MACELLSYASVFFISLCSFCSVALVFTDIVSCFLFVQWTADFDHRVTTYTLILALTSTLVVSKEYTLTPMRQYSGYCIVMCRLQINHFVLLRNRRGEEVKVAAPG